jgi:hypothetical protein
MITSKMLSKLLLRGLPSSQTLLRPSLRMFSSAADPKFGDFTQKIDEASLRPPKIEENEVKLDSKQTRALFNSCDRDKRPRAKTDPWST